MKKTHSASTRIMLLSIFLLFTMYATAEEAQTYTHFPIIAEHINRWGGSAGLTVTWINGTSSLKSLDPVPFYPEVGCVILEVNGYSAQNMQKQQFYDFLKNDTQIRLKYVRKSVGKNDTVDARFSYNILISNGYPDYIPKEVNYKTKNGTRILVDEEIDFFAYNTYDILVIGNDPLTDKQILQNFVARIPPVYARDTKNPDILFMISKNVNQRIESIYVPKTEQVVNTGSSTGYYRFFNIPFSVTTQNNKVVTSGDYTKTVVNTDAYLQFAVLDTKMMTDSTRLAAPIIYQYTYDMHLEEKFDALTKSTDFAPYNPFPYRTSAETCSGYGFCFFDKNLIDVVEGSSADKAGFKAGDKIIAINGHHTYTLRFSEPRRFYKKLSFENIMTKFPLQDQNTYLVKRGKTKIKIHGGQEKLSMTKKCMLTQ